MYRFCLGVAMRLVLFCLLGEVRHSLLARRVDRLLTGTTGPRLPQSGPGALYIFLVWATVWGYTGAVRRV